MSLLTHGKRSLSPLRVAIPCILILAFSVQCLLTAEKNSLTNDEGKHLATGWWLLQHRQCCLGVDNSPLTAYSALPLIWLKTRADPGISMNMDAHKAGRLLIFGSPDPEKLIFFTRVTTVFAGIVLLVIATSLANRYFGPPSGWITLGILAFEPNIIAHYSLVSTDALLTTTVVLFLFTLDTLFRRPTCSRMVLSAAALGMALISKFTALILLPAAVPIFFLYQKQRYVQRPLFWLSCFAVMVGTAGAVVWVGYGFHVSPQSPFIAFPGLTDGFLRAREYATGGMVAYFNGEVGRPGSWRLYFPEALALKTPIPVMVIWLLALVTCLSQRCHRIDKTHLAPVILALLIFAAALMSNLNIGIRHILPVYALMAIACASLVQFIRTLPFALRRITLPAVVIIGIWVPIEAISIFPFYLSYFNQIAGGPTGGIRYLGDSNLDWGQDLKTLKRVMDDHAIKEVILSYLGNTDPAFYGIRYQYLPLMFVGSTHNSHVVDPEREILAVSTNNIQGFMTSQIDLSWLVHREPFARSGYSINLYDVTGDAFVHRKLAVIYYSTGLYSLAKKEMQKVAALGQD